MKIKATWKDGIEVDTDGPCNWSAVILSIGLVIDLAIYIWRI